MKKLFVLFLLVSLVPFSIGCFGSDGGDDEIVYTTLSTSVTVPNALVAPANMRAAKVSYLQLYLNIGGERFSPSTTVSPQYVAASDTWIITFQSSLTLPEAATLRTLSNATIEIVDGTNPAAPVTLVTAVVNFNMTSDSTTVPAVVVALTGGNLQIVSIGGTTTDIVSNPTKAEPTITTFSVTGVVATNAVALNALGGVTPVDADYKTIATLTAPIFTVAFSENYALPTGVTAVADLRWVIYVKNVTSGASFTLDSAVAADKALFTLAANGADKIDITVIGGTSKKLEAASKYMVTFVDSNLTTAGGDVLSKATYLFKTP